MPVNSVFVDTNVLLYLHDRRDVEKARKAEIWLRYLIERKAIIINFQVLNEATDVLLRKKWFENPEQVFSTVEAFAEFGNAPLTHWELEEARIIHLRHRYSWWDCLLLASAVNLGCTHFLSEDLQDGQTVEGLTIVSPFAHSPDQILLSR